MNEHTLLAGSIARNGVIGSRIVKNNVTGQSAGIAADIAINGVSCRRCEVVR